MVCLLNITHFMKKDNIKIACFFSLSPGIPHADDLFYLFAGGPLLAPDHLAGRPSDLRRQDDLRLRDIITTLWTNFAATG